MQDREEQRKKEEVTGNKSYQKRIQDIEEHHQKRMHDIETFSPEIISDENDSVPDNSPRAPVISPETSPETLEASADKASIDKYTENLQKMMDIVTRMNQMFKENIFS